MKEEVEGEKKKKKIKETVKTEKLHMVVHAYNFSSLVEAGDGKARLGYTVSFHFKTK